MSVYGLYQPYKVNRPLNRSEKHHRLHQGRPAKVRFFNNEQSVIRINSTYLETVDKFHKGGGDTGLFALLFFMLVSIHLYVLYHCFFVSEKETKDKIIDIVISSLVMSFFYFLSGYFLLKQWFKWTHYPIRFNRKSKMVYVFRTNGSVLTVPWQDIYFTQDKEPGILNDWSIRGHILDSDGETVLETFSLGVCTDKSTTLEYWEFIRCYMEEDVVPELAELIMFCPPAEDRKEGFIFCWQNLLYMGSRLEWLLLPLTLPLSLEASVWRYITCVTGKIPRWPREVLDACRPDPADPVSISAANNPEKMWRLVFANEPRDVWQERYDRMDAATNKIHAVLAKRYGHHI
ncbi:hypothetical protein A9B99_20705 [Mangrovibacter phragmitis]|uniref:DUF6708 domain-containing protein n=1 Tax=Mangrovibacter phragmitis TaxID=1691903 RepID=A0A1B7L5Q4_9ENTR|nr:DUF6708 domain-containing protein [Mangrovibacter phragmitis]OAT77630.1 hypothetical protein A9B99_20705 [Mangrovibacter phragmitis]